MSCDDTLAVEIRRGNIFYIKSAVPCGWCSRSLTFNVSQTDKWRNVLHPEKVGHGMEELIINALR